MHYGPIRIFPLYIRWLRGQGHAGLASRIVDASARVPLGIEQVLPGPVGERNGYSLRPRGRIAALAASGEGMFAQVGAILATGQTAVVPAASSDLFAGLPESVRRRIVMVEDPAAAPGLGGVVFEGNRDDLMRCAKRIAERGGPILTIRRLGAAFGPEDDALADLLTERTMSINTAAAGGNASLMALDA